MPHRQYQPQTIQGRLSEGNVCVNKQGENKNYRFFHKANLSTFYLANSELNLLYINRDRIGGFDCVKK